MRRSTISHLRLPSIQKICAFKDTGASLSCETTHSTARTLGFVSGNFFSTFGTESPIYQGENSKSETKNRKLKILRFYAAEKKDNTTKRQSNEQSRPSRKNFRSPSLFADAIPQKSFQIRYKQDTSSPQRGYQSNVKVRLAVYAQL